MWDRNAEAWARSLRAGRDEFRTLFLNPTFIRFVGDVRGKKVLDAGCGEGESTRILANSGANAVGVDISPRMLELARAEEERAPLGIEYHEASMADLSLFADESFDCVISTMALMNSAHLDPEMREFFRVLRPGGTLAFSVRHPCFATPNTRIVHDARTQTDRLLVGDYFRTTSWAQTNPCDTPGQSQTPDAFVALRFPYTLSHYLNAMIAAGFTVTQIEEPKPAEEHCGSRAWLDFWRHQAALYLYLKGERPAAP